MFYTLNINTIAQLQIVQMLLKEINKQQIQRFKRTNLMHAKFAKYINGLGKSFK